MRSLVCFSVVVMLLIFSLPLNSLAEQQSPVEDLISMLNADDRKQQDEAAAKLIALKDPAAVKGLTITLRTGNAYAKQHAAVILLEMMDPRSIDAFLYSLADKDKYVASLSKTALMRFGPQAKDTLKTGLKNGEWNIRFPSAELLAAMGDRSGVDVLLDAIRRGGHDQSDALKGLSALNEKKALPQLIELLVDKDTKTQKKAEDIAQRWIRRHPDIIPDFAAALGRADTPQLKRQLLSCLRIVDHPQVRQEAARLAKDPDVQVRITAIQTIAFLKNTEQVPVLLDALNDRDQKVRKYAALALSGLKVKEAAEPLIRYLKEAEQTDPSLINAIANYGQEIVPKITPLLKDKSKHIRRSGAQVLGVIGSTGTVNALIAALKDPEPEVRAAAAQALGKIPDKRSVPALVKAVSDRSEPVKQEAGFALLSLGGKTIAYLNALLKSEDPEERQRAVTALSHMGDDKSLKLMSAALQDSDPEVRLHAAQGLAAFGPRGGELLIAALNDPDLNVRRAALFSLGEIRCFRAVKPVLRLLNTELKVDVLNTLIAIGTEEALPALFQTLKDRDPFIRAMTAEALGEIGDPAAAPKLLPLLSDRNSDVQISAALAIGKLKDPAASAHLLQLLAKGDRQVRLAAVKALGLAGGDEAVAPLLKLLTEKDTGLRRETLLAITLIAQRTKTEVHATAEQIQGLILLQTDQDEQVRVNARAVLRAIGPKAVDSLMEAARSGDPFLRVQSIHALSDIGDQRAGAMILEFLEKDENPEVRKASITALGKLRYTKAVSALVKQLKSEDWRIRAMTASALGNIKDNTAVAALVKLLDDDNERVRKSATEALEQITGEKCPVIATLITYPWIDKMIFVLVVMVLVIPTMRKYIKPFDRLMQSVFRYFQFLGRERTQWWLALSFGIIALLFFIYCSVLRLISPSLEETSTEFITNVSLFTLKIFPFFVGGCLISGMVMKYFSKRNVLPKSMLGTTTVGSLLPLCSCGVVPMTRAMLALDVPRRAVIAFLIVTPVLNPFVIFFSYGVIGMEYTLLRIITVFLLAFVSGILIERIVGKEEVDAGSPLCRLCSSCVSPSASGASSSGLITGWRLMLFLGRFIAIGILLGAVIGTYMPTIMVSKYLGSDFLGLFLASTIGVPVFLCSGEDVLLLKPLLDLGLPMGHAITFTIAANGICVSSIALFFGVLGRKTTIWLTAFFWAGSFVIGYLINIFSRVLLP